MKAAMELLQKDPLKDSEKPSCRGQVGKFGALVDATKKTIEDHITEFWDELETAATEKGDEAMKDVVTPEKWAAELTDQTTNLELVTMANEILLTAHIELLQTHKEQLKGVQSDVSNLMEQ